MTKKIVIVGGVGGGATAASQLRRFDKTSEIVLFDKGRHISFSNCGMPYHIGTFIDDRDSLLFPEEKFSENYNVNVRSGTEVVSIDRDEKSVECRNDEETYMESYDVLILSPGASAAFPDIPGVENKRTFLLHTIPDMDKINEYIRTHQPKTATVTGAGFVGLEMLENLHSLGIQCTMINRSNRIFRPVDEDMSTPVPEHLKEKGITVHLDDGVHKFSEDGKIVHLKSGTEIKSDLNIMSVGIQPNVSLAEEAGLEIGETGGIKVNDYMQTSGPDIYALGDVVETRNYVTGAPVNIALAPPAHRQAYILSGHLNGSTETYKGVLGTAVIKLFDLTIGAAGHNSDQLDALHLEYDSVEVEAKSHAGYYPGAGKLWLKVLFNPEDGMMYGAQAVGFDGADKRLAVLSTAIHAKMKVSELSELELGYAPPYSSPKDPVNILGYKAAGKLKK